MQQLGRARPESCDAILADPHEVFDFIIFAIGSIIGIMLKRSDMMIQIKGLTELQIYGLAEKIADGFKDNAGFNCWGDSPEQRKHVLTHFFNLNLQILIENEMAYATSENYEGICGFWTKSNGLKLSEKLRLLKLAKVISVSSFLKIAKQFSKLKRAESFVKGEKDYLFVFMIVVQEQYRHKGYMRQVMEFVMGQADEKNIPCILETDSQKNEQIYSHYGMKTLSVQPLADDLTYYIMAYNMDGEL
ncbi:GNAT family N-acetyltransferase [Paenibacillus apiarius]|uniref:GNAT family N-acetyltransferase n=1 Tax=Paenibacillus apiarius TaxID=46240 RepID=A0ABT4E012_9BACL|nr:GNAT family N-acetyltransferase [Paenibacillus apiarius]MCY9515070.1 GNAT family N-acetyltransferase [Paenibacillus apiarius]MCY9522944.1 GNAT family N-acetyltransferase [Paenibacillus apiarius]MCY9553747.1 GNAT family N-acetyltransferase [Paenibacillus apiarius]MCY9556420.1 GNAT family N-acetyltransferase [Paenibacillus apiarius]MCY9684854.1 GNAT family N-acetyltransferase [Paenibacillus apiarius]